MDTYKEACVLLHLLGDDTEWDRALAKGSTFQMPNQLRSLFATICIQRNASNTQQLWIRHKDAMIEDYIHFRNISIHNAERRALQHIQVIFQENGMSCMDLGLPDIQNDNLIEEELDLYQEPQTATAQVASLNDQQRSLVDAILVALDKIVRQEPARCHAYFLDGPGGSGKTMVYNTLFFLLPQSCYQSCFQCLDRYSCNPLSRWQNCA
jgi:hypothetical protein